MKKLARILLCLSLLFLLASCADKDPDNFSYDDWATIGVYLSGDIFSGELAELLGVNDWTFKASGSEGWTEGAIHDFGEIGTGESTKESTKKIRTYISINRPGIPFLLPKDIDVGADIADLFEGYGLENMSADELFLRGEKVYAPAGSVEVSYYFYGDEDKYPSAKLSGLYVKEPGGEEYNLRWQKLTFQIKKNKRLCELSYMLDAESGKVTNIMFSSTKFLK